MSNKIFNKENMENWLKKLADNPNLDGGLVKPIDGCYMYKGHRNTDGLDAIGKHIIETCPKAYVGLDGNVYDPCCFWISGVNDIDSWVDTANQKDERDARLSHQYPGACKSNNSTDSIFSKFNLPLFKG